MRPRPRFEDYLLDDDVLGEPFSPTTEEIKAALADIPCSPTLGQEEWRYNGAAVWAACKGSEEGFQLFDEWSKLWFFYDAADTRKRWDSCAQNPPTNVDAHTLFKLAEKARTAATAQSQAIAKRVDELASLNKLDYEVRRKEEAKRLKVREKVLDDLVTERKSSKRTEPKPAPAVDVAQLAAAAKDIIASEGVSDQFAASVGRKLAGEVQNAKLLYLVATSRLFPKTMNGAIKGLSAIGKSHLRDCVLAYMPSKDVVSLTTLSEKALIFLPDDLSHRILSIAEAVGNKEREVQDYLIREIISSGSIRHMLTMKDNETGQFVARVIEKKGPIVFITTTTAGKLHPEIETRILTVETDDTEVQTGRVLAKIAETEGGLGGADGDLTAWHAFQLHLAAGELRVVIPFAGRLARLTWGKAVRMRRDFSQVLRAVKTHALIHRDHRQRDDQGRIVASIRDYEVIYDLLAARLAESSEVKLRKVVQQTVEAVMKLEKDHSEGVPTKEVAKFVKRDRTTVWRRLDTARQRGFLENRETQHGREARWRTTTGELPSEDVLPTAAELEQEIIAASDAKAEEGTPTPKTQATMQQSGLTR
jgi:hypothetical protein